jgi:general secretion pathway protein H
MRGGRCSHFSFKKPRLGFTLIELLVVIAIIAFATAGVSFAIRDSSQTALDREAERLAALFEAARAQSRASGVAVRWRLTDNGFAFDGLPPQALPTQWQQAGFAALPLDGNGRALPVLQLGPEPIIAAQQVLLSTEGPLARSVRITTDGLRPFTVQAVP